MGFTVIVNVLVFPVQVYAVGVTPIVAIIGVAVVLELMKLWIGLFVPDDARLISGLSFDHA